MDTLRTVIGGKIKTLRKSQNMSQADLADLIGCDSPLISRYERGINLPGIDQLIRIAEVFQIAPGELLPGGQDVERAHLMALRAEIAELVAVHDASASSLKEVVKLLTKFNAEKNLPKG
ncbi:helix-turn-helix transcriptional regulator (plasmid) [Pseudomonas sp. HR96]|uniref:helix-turn-helix domain-containing protein n=1 Tax=Pseudomonas sp. HR96 TaxID=1027966 RepID=UPI002A74C9B2|nr:helix-turn-helix transcriptional regulator [Pseudomonas sp. HR96]WPP02556.1 helix-turn-helix transcriptional regulator [Pseudomonas sp. HR96]